MDQLNRRLLSLPARFHRDVNGLESMEVLLILAAVIIPLCIVILKLARALGEYYSFVSGVVSLPFL